MGPVHRDLPEGRGNPRRPDRQPREPLGEELLGLVALQLDGAGVAVEVRVDGRATPLSATVSFVSTEAEFTPPVIYSRENRTKLVFMVEAKFSPEDARTLRPGQPVDVKLSQ